MDAEWDYSFPESANEMFVDDYELPDVMKYRNIFRKCIADLEVKMHILSGRKMEFETWQVGEPIVLVTYDERTFAAHDAEESLAEGWAETTSKRRRCKINPCQRLLV